MPQAPWQIRISADGAGTLAAVHATVELVNRAVADGCEGLFGYAWPDTWDFQLSAVQMDGDVVLTLFGEEGPDVYRLRTVTLDATGSKPTLRELAVETLSVGFTRRGYLKSRLFRIDGTRALLLFWTTNGLTDGSERLYVNAAVVTVGPASITVGTAVQVQEILPRTTHFGAWSGHFINSRTEDAVALTDTRWVVSIYNQYRLGIGEDREWRVRLHELTVSGTTVTTVGSTVVATRTEPSASYAYRGPDPHDPEGHAFLPDVDLEHYALVRLGDSQVGAITSRQRSKKEVQAGILNDEPLRFWRIWGDLMAVSFTVASGTFTRGNAVVLHPHGRRDGEYNTTDPHTLGPDIAEAVSGANLPTGAQGFRARRNLVDGGVLVYYEGARVVVEPDPVRTWAHRVRALVIRTAGANTLQAASTALFTTPDDRNDNVNVLSVMGSYWMAEGTQLVGYFAKREQQFVVPNRQRFGSWTLEIDGMAVSGGSVSPGTQFAECHPLESALSEGAWLESFGADGIYVSVAGVGGRLSNGLWWFFGVGDIDVPGAEFWDKPLTSLVGGL